jgi:hypothetical protein
MKMISHQTVRLSAGKHASPQHGACVMELASMLAGEDFSDHPQSVSRPIAAFLRLYNDALDDGRRQDLYEYASRVVGTSARPSVEALRSQWLIAWGDRRWDARCRWWLGRRLKRRTLRDGAASSPEDAARYAIRSIGRITDELHHEVLAFIDDLISSGGGADAHMLNARRAEALRSACNPARAS